MKDIGFTIPFVNKPDPDSLWGYRATGRNGDFNAAGVTLTARTNAFDIPYVDLANLTGRGLQAHHCVEMPPEVMDQLAVRWLVGRGYGKIVAAGLVGWSAEPVQPVTISDGAGHEDQVGPGHVGAITSGMDTGQLAGVLIKFHGGSITVLLHDLFDPAKWQLWRPY